MENNNQVSAARVNTGSQDGLKVYAIPDNGLYVVEAPNFYDVYWPLTGKMEDKKTTLGYRLKPEDITSTQLPWIDEQIAQGHIKPEERTTFGLMNLLKFDENGKPSFKEEKSVHIAVPMDNLATEENITSFNFAVRNARAFNKERIEELNRFKFANGRDGELSEKLRALSPEDAFTPSSTLQLSTKFGKPEKSFTRGLVVDAGKFYTMVYTGATQKEIEGKGLVKTMHVQVVNTADILDGDDWKLGNREKAIREKCPEGEYMSFNWSDNSKIRLTSYNPEKAQENKAKKLQEQEKFKAEIDPSKPTAPRPFSEKTQQPHEEPAAEKIDEHKQESAPEKKATGKSKAKAKTPEMAR